MQNKEKFIRFLSERHLVPEHRLKFYGIWAVRFVAFRGGEEAAPVDGHELEAFSRSLATTHEEWQIRQAGDAVRLYSFFLQSQEEGVSAPEQNTTDFSGLEEKMRQVVRLRHLSLATERTYLFRNVLGRELDVSSLAVRAKRGQRLPVVLSRQELLGHSKLQTTMIYTHVTSKNRLGVRSPLDTP